jgi:hypothetical protein
MTPSEAEIMVQGVQGRKLDGRLSYLQNTWAEAGNAVAHAEGQKHAPIEGQALLHIVDDNHANSTFILKNLVLVRHSAGARSTSDPLDYNLQQRQLEAACETGRVDPQCSL